MVDSNSNRDDRSPPPFSKPRLPDLPEIKIPPPPGADASIAPTQIKLPPPPTHRRPRTTPSTHELLLPCRKNSFRAKVLLFSVIGFGVGILVGVGFLLG